MSHAAHDDTRPENLDAGPIRPPDTGLPSTAVPEPSDDATPEEIEADIARTRRDLAETVGALSAKLDPKAQAEQQVDDVRATVNEQKAKLQNQADHARDSAQASLEQARVQARDVITDDEGRPSPALWAAGGAAAGLLVAAIVLLARPSR